MKPIAVLGAFWLCIATARCQETTAQPVLRNAGKPMVLECHCDEADVHAAGLSCTAEDPCPLFLELDSVETTNNRIFLSGNIHSASSTLYSVLLVSEDGGKSWREPYERLKSAGFGHIEFVDFENGWISGEMQLPLPHDPFLLVTSDGGNTWRARPVFGDPQFGSILTFAFNSRANGSMVIDRGSAGEGGRYELYESNDAGETWMLRQTNVRPIQMKHPAPANADWRIRADGPSKSYRVEHHAGNAWHNVAAFAVSIGVCKPPEPIAPAPEAPAGSPKPQPPER